MIVDDGKRKKGGRDLARAHLHKRAEMLVWRHREPENTVEYLRADGGQMVWENVTGKRVAGKM
jgi:hypothetical protein